MKRGRILQFLAMLLWIVVMVSCKKEEIKMPPVVKTVDPVNAAGETGIDIKISATFDKDMNPATINTSTFIVRQGTTIVSGLVSYLDRKATFTPQSNLAILTHYSAVITTGAKSTSGDALRQNYEWDFTTCHPPKVVSTMPITDATCVNPHQIISATFNHELDPATVTASTFKLMTGSTSVAGTVTYSPTDNTAIFTPASDLSAGTSYTATLTTGIFNDMNMHMELDYSWSFIAFGSSCTVDQACGPLNIDLMSAGGYGILAGSGITNVGFSEIHDMNIGISPGFRSSVTGFPPGTIFNGALIAADDIVPSGALATQAQLDLTTAYLVAKASTVPTPVVISADLGGRTLVPGIYTSTSTMLLQSGDLILDASQAPCDANSVWIFQVGSALTTVGGTGGNIILTGGAQARNVYWQVGSSATIGDGTSFKGTVMALTSITMGAGARVEGRVLARNGAVTLTSANIITKP